MSEFQVIQPSALLSPYVKQYWFVSMNNVQGRQRLVPFGHTALCFYRSNRAYSLTENGYMPRSAIHGMMTGHIDITYAGGVDFICIVFQPAGANAIFKGAVGEICNNFVSLDALGDKQLQILEERLNETKNTSHCVALIEQFLLRRIYQHDGREDERLVLALKSIDTGVADVNHLARTACLGYKQFKRLFSENIGINPKKYLQIHRFRKLHHLLQQHTPISLSQLAYECGYYDKSHLIKELKDFSGFTPTELAGVCDPVYSDYHALFRSAFVDNPI